MSPEFQPYTNYRDSGVPWLGRIPAHWEVVRLKQICTRSALYGANIPAPSYTPTGVRFLRTTDILEDGSLRSGGVHVPEQLVPDHILANDDLLISRSGTVGRSFLYKRANHGPCSYAGYLVRFELGPRAVPEFVFYFTKTVAFADFLRVSSIQSTIENVNGEKYANSTLPLPPHDEQLAIVRFLIAADRKFSHLIRNKRCLIALLNEEKQVIVQQAVTRGLNPDVPMKPSGVAWLGEIPAHWGIRRLKSLTEFVTSGSRGWAEHYSDDGPIFLRIGNISTTSIRLKLNHIQRVSPPQGSEGERTRVLPNDILVSITAQMGAIGLVPAEIDEAYVNQHIALVRLRAGRVEPRWTAYCLLSPVGKQQFNLRTNGGTKIGLTLDDVRTVEVPIPPSAEQKRITAHIDESIKQVDQVVDRISREIDLIREYRTRLIADVVTGQLDVREAAALLPDLEHDASDALLAEADRLVEDADLTDEDEPFVLDEDDVYVAMSN